MSDRITNNAKLCELWTQPLAISFCSGLWELLVCTSVNSQCPGKSKLWETGDFGVSLGIRVLFRNPPKLGLTWGTVVVSSPSSVHPTEFFLYLCYSIVFCLLYSGLYRSHFLAAFVSWRQDQVLPIVGRQAAWQSARSRAGGSERLEWTLAQQWLTKWMTSGQVNSLSPDYFLSLIWRWKESIRTLFVLSIETELKLTPKKTKKQKSIGVQKYYLFTLWLK